MKKLVLILFVFFFACSQTGDFPKIAGFKPTSEVRIYTPDNLWEYIDGAADQFLDYNFQELKSCDLSKGDLSVSVDIYEMGSNLEAFGIYVNERPTNRERLPFGVEGTVSPPYQALLLKGNQYVKIDVLEGEIDPENGKALLQAVAEALQGSTNLPEELKQLPEKWRVKGSFKFANKAFLGLSELNKCIYADYSDEQKNEFLCFVMNLSTADEVNSTWKTLSEKWEARNQNGETFLTKQIPYQGAVAAIRKNGKIYGITGFESEEDAMKILWEILK